MIKTNSDACESSSRLPSNLFPISSTGCLTMPSIDPSLPVSPIFPLCLPNTTSPAHSLSLSGIGKHPMEFLGHISPRSYLDYMGARREVREATPKARGDSPDISGWPTVVDSRIPFTTYLQNLTRTLHMAAAKGTTASTTHESDKPTRSLPATSTPSNSHRPCASPPQTFGATSSPRSQSCGSQAEPDSSCCDDDRDGEPKENDEDIDNISDMDHSEMSERENKNLEKTNLKSPTFRSSIFSGRGEGGITVEKRNKISNMEPQLNKTLTGLVIPPAHNNQAEICQGPFSAPVVPSSPVPTSPLSALSASLPYHFRSNMHHALLENSPDVTQHQHHHHHHHTLQQKSQSPPSSSGETNILSSSLPVSLLHYHLQGQQQQRHHQQQHHQQHFQQVYHQNELRPHPCSDPVQNSRLFLESTFFQQPLSLPSSSGGNKSPARDAMFTKMLLDSRPQPGTSLMTSETTPGMSMSGSRGFSALTADVGSLLHTSFLGLSGLGMRRPHVEKPAPVKKYKCDVCQKAFSRSNTLVTHKRIHTGDKPFKCEVCGRAFRQPGNLTRHRLTHTTHKPYVCQVCSKAFNRASNLNTHIRTHSSFRQFPCSAGAKTFPQKADLTSHVFVHTGEQHRGFPH